MNTGIQDAANLAWKLAFASRADGDALLASYEHERRPVARRTIALTRAAFWAEASTTALPSLLRGRAVPVAAPAFPWLVRRRALLAPAARVLAQFDVAYLCSPLSRSGGERRHARSGLGARLRPGARVPDSVVRTAAGPTSLHGLLARPGVHLLLGAGAAQVEAVEPNVHVHRVVDWAGDEVVAVRPDAYVGFRGGGDCVDALRDWLALLGLAGQVRAGAGAATAR
jgi:hypothetical protein